MVRWLYPIFIACLSGVALLTAGVAASQPLDWNQEKVTSVARQLSKALDDVLADPEIDAKQATAMQQREHEAAISSIRELNRNVKDLARRLGTGYTRDESEVFFGLVTGLRSDIRAYARSSWLPERTRLKVEKAAGLIDRLSRYYQDA
jgi:hypothetical protein